MARTRCFCYHFAVAVSFGLTFSQQQTSTMVRMTTETISATVRNELRRTAAIKMLAYVFTKSSMKKDDMERIMFECYHDNKVNDIASHVSMIATAKSVIMNSTTRLVSISHTLALLHVQLLLLLQLVLAQGARSWCSSMH